MNHSKVFTSNFKHNLLYFNICSNKERAGTSNEYQQRFMTCLYADDNSSDYFYEWREKLNKEMNTFNGKTQVNLDAETNSMSSASTGITAGMQPKTQQEALYAESRAKA